MRIQLVGSFLGKIMVLLGIAMVFPMLWAIYYQEHIIPAFAGSIGIAVCAGVFLLLICRPHPADSLRQREGFAIVTLGWIVATIFGSLPYLFSGTMASPINAIFETMSGFTTTGASILTNVEIVPKGILMWRSLTHWLGGLGIVVLFVALAAVGPGGTAGGSMLIRAEYSGGSLADRISPRMSDTARALWLTYFGITALMVLLLRLGGMSFYDSLIHTFGTVSTGGFSSKNASMGFYNNSPYLQWVTIVFMILCGANLAFYYLLLVQKRNLFFKSTEFRVYMLVILVTSVLICVNLLQQNVFPGASLEYVFRQSIFQVVSVITTTGFTTTDYNLWPPLAFLVIFLLMFCGGCQGSTAGAIKMSRWVVLFKNIFAELELVLHSKVVRRVRINGRPLSQEAVSAVLQFFALYIILFFAGALLFSACGMPFLESVSAAATALGNIGPGLGTIGPVGNYAAIPQAAKIVFTLLMLLGRLEIYTVLVLFMAGFWRK